MRIYSGSINAADFQPAGNGMEIMGIISEGRTFCIYKARMGARLVALKTTVNRDAMSESLLRREYGLGKDLSHQSIASILGFEDGTPVGPAIVMEYVEGKTLDEYIATAPPLSSRKSVLKDILDGVDYLHHRGILHNDLKPDNIIVNSYGAARIIDFGLSTSDNELYSGLSGGTDGYTAPEILEGKGASGAASDMYSIGLLINLIFGGRKYRRLARKCCKANPSERIQGIDGLRKGISAADRGPVVAVSVVAALVLVALVLRPALSEHAEKAKFEELVEHYEKEMSSFYLPIHDRLLKLSQDSIITEQTADSATRSVREYIDSSARYAEINLKQYQQYEADGSMSVEYHAFYQVLSRQQSILGNLAMEINKKAYPYAW